MGLHRLAAGVMALAFATISFAQTATPSGVWQTISEETGQASSHVRITEANGSLTATVEKILDPAKASLRCTECTDSRKDQPIEGMVLFKDVKFNPEATLTWDGGEILDPKSGKNYRARIRLIDDGKTLEVRGYKGPFFRTQLWQRLSE